VAVQSLRGSPSAVNTRRARAQTNPVHGVVLMELAVRPPVISKREPPLCEVVVGRSSGHRRTPVISDRSRK
jgi:hypothetical protein